ncbi:cytochrome bc complex cytochrome b subunit [Natranaeroarchaeum aerophilus]|uniref:Cytochrome bc complex cytochrome b subunit n=1 Tax=Natranaeroarchaeum aerophilus TaxID=2917711 RepID=A0AAE3FUQ6_9EURY|nr:cytochrome bc complex cytochrome b subunit [Natranaeroarchaeum aerophilus]MCL9814924.1 cytochrome bc complex cytochrome b subunit [Natranaeroarchaeum aerophilus]
MSEDQETRADGSGTGIVPPDDETPTWRNRKERTQGLSRLTYEYFERARREDQDLRQESDYVERDVLGFPAWPHETIRNLAITSFFIGIIIFLSATMPPHFGDPADPSTTPAVILPDWYLYWSFGLLQTDPLNPELAILGGERLMQSDTFGVLVHAPIIGLIFLVPFLNKGSARRPVEEPFWAALGMTGVMYSFTWSALAIDNIIAERVPMMTATLLFDLVFIVPIVSGVITYSVLKAMQEGYMYNLNRRYYRLRPPR